MVNISSNPVVATALGVAVGCFGYYANASTRGVRELCMTSTMMGGVGYCLGVLTGSRAPLILAVTLTMTNFVAALCRAHHSRYDAFMDSMSLGIPMATGMTILSRNALINGYSAAAIAITVVAIDVIRTFEITAMCSYLARGLINCFKPRETMKGHYARAKD